MLVVVKQLTLNDLTNKKKYRKIVEPIILDSEQKNDIICKLEKLWKDENKLYDAYDSYRKKYKSCRKYYSKYYKILKKNSSHPLGISRSSNAEEATLECLHELFANYQLFYFHSHKFYFCRNHIFSLLELDFYCIMIHDKRLIQFVIEIDGLQHQIGGFGKKEEYDDINLLHVRDVMKQYYLSQMNIHLLRINNFENIKDQIENFMNDIITTTKYIIVNPTECQDKYFKSKSKHDGLQLFFNYFSKRHAYEQDKINSEIEREYDSEDVLDDYNPEGVDYVISADEFKKLMDREFY